MGVTDMLLATASRLSISIQKLLGILGLLLAAALFGIGNVVQKPLMAEIDVWAVLALRASFAVLFLLPFAAGEWRKWHSARNSPPLGVVVLIASFALGMGLHNLAGANTTAINVGFLVNSYVIFMPLTMLCIGEGWPSMKLLVVSFTCFVGAALLSGGSIQGLSAGDIMALGAAAAYAVWIIAVAKVDGRSMPMATLVCMQWLPLILLGGFMTETKSAQLVSFALANVSGFIVLGSLTGGLAYVMAIKCQHHMSPLCASIIYPMEGVFGLVFAAIFLNENLTLLAAIGSAVVFASVCAAGTANENQKVPTETRT